MDPMQSFLATRAVFALVFPVDEDIVSSRLLVTIETVLSIRKSEN